MEIKPHSSRRKLMLKKAKNRGKTTKMKEAEKIKKRSSLLNFLFNLKTLN
jgi:hypothetical protein